MRSRIATRFDIDAVDLTGEDTETLLAQAQRLAEIDRKARLAHANVAPREGESARRQRGDDSVREFLAELFGVDD